MPLYLIENMAFLVCKNKDKFCRVSSAEERCPEEAGVPSSTLGPGIFLKEAGVASSILALGN